MQWVFNLTVTHCVHYVEMKAVSASYGAVFLYIFKLNAIACVFALNVSKFGIFRKSTNFLLLKSIHQVEPQMNGPNQWLVIKLIQLKITSNMHLQFWSLLTWLSWHEVTSMVKDFCSCSKLFTFALKISVMLVLCIS